MVACIRFWGWIAVAALSAFLQARADDDPRLTQDWPSVEAVSEIKGQDVQWISGSPFSPLDIGKGPEREPQATALGTLFMPPGEHRVRSVPAVVTLHGSGGVLAARELTYGQQLASMGIAVLVIDSFRARRELGTSYLERVLNITETMMVEDAYSALRYLSTIPDIDPRHVALVGFSYGAMATTYALYDQMAQTLSPDGLKFAGHVAFYGPCIARYENSKTTGAPLLMLYGKQDELMNSERCAEIADDLRKGGSDVEIVAYDKAVHQWDGGFGQRLIGRQLAECSFTVKPDGTIHDNSLGFDMTNSSWRKVSLAYCTSGPGYPIGRDDVIREKSNRDFGRFLAKVLY